MTNQITIGSKETCINYMVWILCGRGRGRGGGGGGGGGRGFV